jgi:hypothetical protein
MLYLVRVCSCQDRLSVQWDSQLESSSDKTISHPSPPFSSQSSPCCQHTTESQGVVGSASAQCDGIDRGRRSKVDPTQSDAMRRSDGVQRAPSRQYSSVCRQVLLLLGTQSCADDNKHSGKEVGGGGDRRLRVLSELLSRRLSHRMPNLSWRLCALTRYDVRGLTARGIWLWLARPTVLWVGNQLRGQGK